MCALINWFTQRLSHVDITLVQGLIVDFYYDKSLMAEWVVTASSAEGSVIDFHFKRHSLVGYDSLKETFKLTVMRKVCDNFWQQKSFLSDSSPSGMTSLSLNSFPIQKRSIILLETVLSSCISCFNFRAAGTKIQKLCRLPLRLLFIEQNYKYFSAWTASRGLSQGGHVIKCKQIY